MPENYNIGITGDASQLKQELNAIDTQINNIGKNGSPEMLNDWRQKLKEIQKTTESVYNVMNKFGGSVAMPTKDFDKMSASAQKSVKQMEDLQNAINNLGRSGKFDGKGVTQDMKQAYATLNNQINSVKANMQETGNMTIKPDVDIKDAVRELKLLQKETERSKEIAQEQSSKKTIASNDQRDIRQAKRIRDDGQKTGSVSYNDRQRLNAQLDRISTYKSTASSERSSANRSVKEMKANSGEIGNLRNELNSGDPSLTRERERVIKENIAKLTEENQQLQKAAEASRKRAQQYESHVNDLEDIQGTQGMYSTKAQRGSMRAMVEDRATSFGMATVGASAGVIGSSYMKGEQFNKSTRDDMFYMGNIQGRDDYDKVRKDMFKNGIDTGLGYSGQDLLSMNKSYLSYNGYNGEEDFNKGMEQYQRSGRALNIDQEAFEGTYENIGMTGALEGKNGEGVESFTNTLVGALDKSKMTARSEEQVKALGDVVTTLGQTRNLTTGDLEDTVALQGSLASTGDRQLQGEKGANVMNTLSESMMNSGNDPLALQVQGYGSELTGIGGLNEAKRRNEEGATLENINKYMDAAGDDKDQQVAMLSHLGLSVEQSEALVKAKDEGKLDEDYVKKLKADSKKEGKDKADKDVENVKNSSEGKANQAETKTEAQDSETARLADKVIKPLQNFVGSFGNGAYLIMKAAMTLAASASFIAASTGAAGGVRRGASVLPGETRAGRRARASRSGGKTGGTGGTGAAVGGSRARAGNQKRSTATPPPGRKTGRKSGGSGKSGGSSGIVAGSPFGGSPGGEGKLGRMAGGMGRMAMPMMMLGGMGTGGGTDEEGNPQGGSPMGGMLSTMLQWYMMDMVLDKGIGGAKNIFGKVKGTDWKGLANKGKGTLKRNGGKGVANTVGNLGKNTWGKFANNKTVGKAEDVLGKGFDKTKGFASDKLGRFKGTDWKGLANNGKQIGKQGLDKVRNFGGQSPTGTMSKIANKGSGMLGKLGKVGKFGKGIPMLGGALGALGVGSSLMEGDTKGASEGAGATVGGIAGGTLGSLIPIPGVGTVAGSMAGAFLGDKVGGFMHDKISDNNEAIKDGNFFGKDGLIDFSWSNGDKDGKGGFGDSLLAKGAKSAWGGITSFFGGGDKKPDKAKGGGGGGADISDIAGTDPRGAESEKLKGLTDNRNLSGKEFDTIAAGGLGRPNPGGAGASILGLNGVDETLTKDEDKDESGSGKAKKGETKAKKNKAKGERNDAERLRQKNNESESKNLGVYRNLLNRAEQIIQEAKSLDLEGGGSDDSKGDGKSASDVGGKGKKKIYDFLKGKGLSDNQVAAVMGNLEQESNLDPNAKNPTSGAFGIAQWLDDRKGKLDAFAKSKGKKNNDLDVQLDFLWSEIEKGYNSDMLKAAGWSDKASLEKNTHAFATGFERMGANEAMMGTRVNNAKGFKKKYGGGGKGGGGGGATIAMPELIDTMGTINNNALMGNQAQGSGGTNTDNRTFNVSVNVTGTDSPKETAQRTAEAFEDLLSGMDTFANEYTRE